MKTDLTKTLCPRCRKRNVGRFPGDTGALSRANNRSLVCSPCGHEEAMLVFTRGETHAPAGWPVRETPLADEYDRRFPAPTIVAKWAKGLYEKDYEALDAEGDVVGAAYINGAGRWVWWAEDDRGRKAEGFARTFKEAKEAVRTALVAIPEVK